MVSDERRPYIYNILERCYNELINFLIFFFHRDTVSDNKVIVISDYTVSSK